MANVLQLGDSFRTEFSVAEVAELTGQSRFTVWQRCIDGDFHGAYQRGRSWRIPAAALTPPT